MDIINPYIHGGEALTFDGFGNRSRSFDGVDDVIDLGNTNSRNNNQTVCAWVKATAFDSTFGNAYFSKWNGNVVNGREWLLWLSWATPNRLEYRITQSNGTIIIVTSPTNIVLNQWTHVAGVADGNNIYLYIDGSLVATTAYDGTNSAASNSIATIGGMNYPNTNSHNASGNLADCRIYDTDLTATEISDIYNGTNITTNLVGHWLTDADNLLDAAGTNHGTNYGTKYSYDNPSPPVEFGRASRSFDGVNDYVSIPDIDESTTNLSVALWLKTTDQDWVTTHFAHWRNQDNNRAWWIGPSRTAETNGKKLMVYLSGGGAGNATIKRYYGTTDVSDGTWHHVAFTWDNGTLKLFVDGSEETTTKVANDAMTSIYNSDGDLTVGCTLVNDLPANFGSGGRADIRIYNSTLTATDISDLYAGTDVQTNLVGHWLTDNDDVEDKAGTNDGTNFGSTYSYDNPPMDLIPSRQASRSFNGSSDRVTIPANVFNGATALTVSAWIKLDSLGINQTVIGRLDEDDGFRLMVRDTNKIDLIWGDGSSFFVSTQDAAVLTSGTWIHVAGTFNNSGNATRYVDGVQTGTIDDLSSYGSLSILGDVGIGARVQPISPFYNLPLDGKIADVRIYDTDLTASQILAIYNGTTDRTNLIGQWLTNSDDVIDHAGTNDGTNFGSTYSTDSPS